MGSASQVRWQWELSNTETASAWGSNTSNEVISILQVICELQIAVSIVVSDKDAQSVQSLINTAARPEAPSAATGFAGKSILLLEYFVLMKQHGLPLDKTEYNTVGYT